MTVTSTRRHPADEAPDKATRPAWDDQGGDEAVGPLLQMSQHPPGYYRLMAAVLAVERAVLGGPLSADRELALLRLVNVALITPLPLLAWWAVRRFGHPDRTGVTAAVAVFAFPMLTHIGASLNNDNLFTLCGAALVALLAGVVRGDRRTGVAVGIGLVSVVAFLTKGFAVIFPPLIVAAYLVGLRHQPGVGWRRRLATLVRPVGWVAGLTLVGAGWWYLRVWSRTGQFAPSLEAQRLTSDLRPEGFSVDPFAFVQEFSELLGTRFWGSFGWYSVRAPAGLALLATVVVVAAVVGALWPRADAAGNDRWARLLLLGPIGALALFTAARSWDLYVTTGGFRFIQGRYLLAGIVGLVVLVAIGVHRLLGRWSSVVVLGTAAVAQAEALRRVVPGWWGDVGLGPRGQVQALVAWSAWPGEALAAVAVAALAAGLWLCWELIAPLLRPEPDDRVPVGSVAP